MEGFDTLFNMFAPKPGMDPFAIGGQLATNPDAMAGQLGTLGPPPPKGVGFMDHLTNLLGGGTPESPSLTGPLSSNPTAPSPLLGPAAATPPTPPGIESVPGVGPVPTTTPPMPKLGGVGVGTGIENVPGVGPVPGGPMPPIPPSPPAPPAPPAGTLAPPPTQGAKPDILAPLTNTPAPSPTMTPEKIKAIQTAMQGAGSLMKGVAAPPAPATQKIASPGIPHTTAMPGGSNIAALIQALTGNAAPALPLRLGNALLAGGRGLY